MRGKKVRTCKGNTYRRRKCTSVPCRVTSLSLSSIYVGVSNGEGKGTWTIPCMHWLVKERKKNISEVRFLHMATDGGNAPPMQFSFSHLHFLPPWSVYWKRKEGTVTWLVKGGEKKRGVFPLWSVMHVEMEETHLRALCFLPHHFHSTWNGH
jgi:hypothetical protein